MVFVLVLGAKGPGFIKEEAMYLNISLLRAIVKKKSYCGKENRG